MNERWTQADINTAERNGISYATFRRRVLDYGWSVERAKTHPTNPKLRRSNTSTHYTREDVERARANGISYNVFTARMRLGWSVDKAATKPKRTHRNTASTTPVLQPKPTAAPNKEWTEYQFAGMFRGW